MPCTYCQKEKVVAKGLCSACYYHLKRHGTLERKKHIQKQCEIDGCEGAVVARGWCEAHYTRWKRHGDPSVVKRPSDWGERTSHPRYKSWHGLLRRCYDPKSNGFVNYGARGIKVCDAWHDFWRFLEDTGEPPSPHHSLDRIDNSGDYEPGNVRWATPKEQARNRRSTVITEDDAKEIKRRARAGEMAGDISRALGIAYDHVRNVIVGNSWAE